MSEIDAVRAILQTDLYQYCSFVNSDWIDTKVHRYLCNRVQDFLEANTGHAYDILVLSMPPQHGKSKTITETVPSWFLGHNPTKRVIEISYSEDFAEKFGRGNRRKIEEYGASIFGISLAKSPNTATEFELDNHSGGMISRGITSGVTGNGCSLMIIDDPVKTQQEADSESSRGRLWDEWLSSYKSRLSAGAKIIIIMTRWHEDDLAGRVIGSEKNVQVLNLPLEAEEKGDPLGRNIGDALCPEIGKDNKWLQTLRTVLTPKREQELGTHFIRDTLQVHKVI